MRSTESPHHRIFRQDYQAPAWNVERVELEFDLCAPVGDKGQHDVRVVCRQWLNATNSATGALTLDGRDISLLEIRVDDELLSEDAYTLGPDSLVIPEFPASAVLETVGRIRPFENTALEGLYGSAGLLCTQCESHGFSRITWFQDRPDVLSVYQVSITANAERYPVLLSNGNRVSETEDGDIRTVVWEDPHPKPCYLFALVAGDLSCVKDSHTTSSGRDVEIEFWCDPGLEGQLDHAIASLKNAMVFDEEVYQREYDLDLYMVVVARAFNMGAMENKGLNIFNPQCVLAHHLTATDEDHVLVEAVVAHEYLHNWTGNRITCRDWFQLSLKEGLTVFREQQFSAAHAGGSAQRIHEVQTLKSRQFVEDSGPLAHPVRPESYVDMNNFYTVTVYEKGAELIRVLHACVGEQGYFEGMQKYFERFDGQAATLEDFVSCFSLEDVGLQGGDMLRWYDRAGTPRLGLNVRDEGAGTFHAELEQMAPRNAKEPDHSALPIPVQLQFVDSRGALKLANGESEFHTVLHSHLLGHDIEFERDVEGLLTPVFSGGLPAPVHFEYTYSTEQLQLIARFATDPVAVWEAQQQLYREAIQKVMDGHPAETAGFMNICSGLDETTDRAVFAERLALPSVATMIAEGEDVDPLAMTDAHAQVERALAHAVWAAPEKLIPFFELPGTWSFRAEDVAARRLAIRLLQLGLLAGQTHLHDTAWNWVHHADNLSQQLGALDAVWHAAAPDYHSLHAYFVGNHREHELVIDRAVAVRARYATRNDFVDLLASPEYKRTSPNRVRAVMQTFMRANPGCFYEKSGESMRAWMAEIIALDAVNPQLTARLIGMLESSFRLAEPWRSQIYELLEAARSKIQSPTVIEQLGRILESADT